MAASRPASHAEDVKKRQTSHDDVVGLEVQEAARYDRLIAREVAVGELGVVGHAGSAGSVQDDRSIVGSAGQRPSESGDAGR
jgi:hypothetical protein